MVADEIASHHRGHVPGGTLEDAAGVGGQVVPQFRRMDAEPFEVKDVDVDPLAE